jgi:hypothetical protein
LYYRDKVDGECLWQVELLKLLLDWIFWCNTGNVTNAQDYEMPFYEIRVVAPKIPFVRFEIEGWYIRVCFGDIEIEYFV